MVSLVAGQCPVDNGAGAMANGANHELPLTTVPEALVRLEGAPESAFGETILARVDGVWQAFVRASSFRAFEPLGLRAPPRWLVDQVPPKVALLTNDGGEHTLLPLPDDRERVRALFGASAEPAVAPVEPPSPSAHDAVAVAPPPSVGLERDLAIELQALLDRGRRIEAIRTYRERTGSGLAEAKAAVDALAEAREGMRPRGAAPLPSTDLNEEKLAAAMLALLERKGAPLGTDPMAVQRVHEAARVAVGELLREGAATVNLPYLSATQGPVHLKLRFVRNATNCAVFDLSTSPAPGRSAPLVLVVVVALFLLVLAMLLVVFA